MRIEDLISPEARQALNQMRGRREDGLARLGRAIAKQAQRQAEEAWLAAHKNDIVTLPSGEVGYVFAFSDRTQRAIARLILASSH